MKITVLICGQALTSAIIVAQVGKAPHIAQAHGIAEQGQQKVEPTRPVAALQLIGRRSRVQGQRHLRVDHPERALGLKRNK